MLIVEKLFLTTLNHQDDLAPVAKLLDQALIAAVITDLEQAHLVAFGPADRSAPTLQDNPKVSVVRADYDGDNVLSATLGALDPYRSQQLSTLTGQSKLNPTQHVGTALAEQGAVEEHSRLIGASTFTELDATADQLRAHYAALLTDQQSSVDLADRLVLGALEALNAVGVVLGDQPSLTSWTTADFSSRVQNLVGHLPAVHVLREAADSMGSLIAKSQLS